MYTTVDSVHTLYLGDTKFIKQHFSRGQDRVHIHDWKDETKNDLLSQRLLRMWENGHSYI